MNNYSIEDYKKAIKAKYEREKDSDGLSSPSQANLRDLCWEIFEKNRNEDDLIVFSSFFGFAFDVTKKNEFKKYTDKFKPIGTFFKGKTDLSSRSAVNLAAILVDFENRPFLKFKEKGFLVEEMKKKNAANKESFYTEEMSLEEKKDLKEIRSILPQSKKTESFSNLTINILSQFKKRIKVISLGLVVLSCVSFALTDKIFVKKKCMQWSGDHYEIVSCNFKTEGIILTNPIESFDKSVVNLKKINVCDTTICFDKDGLATVWYAKTLTGIEFFNANGRHPENGSSLKPITSYVLDKYVKKKPRFNAKI